MTNICIDCGREYDYDSSNPLGASAYRCCACRKRQSRKNKKIKLFFIASPNPACRICGYSNPVALNLVDAIERFNKPENEKEKEQAAKTQFIVCSNHLAEIQEGEIGFKVTNSKSYPVEVSFFSRKVLVVEEPLKAAIEYSSDAKETEVVTGRTCEAIHAEKGRFAQQPAPGLPYMQD